MSGFQNIVEADGIGIAITGMLIVFVALILISVCIAQLPRMLGHLNRVLPEIEHHGHGGHATKPARKSDDTALVAAVAFAVHQHRQRQS